MLSIVSWKWKPLDGKGPDFGPVYVNRLKAGFARHLHVPHEFVCVTDDPAGIDSDVRIVPLPETYRHTPRCRRRMQHFDETFARTLGDRILAIDLDMVIVGDLTPLVDRPEPLVCWQVAHTKVFSGSFILMTPGVLQPLWDRYAADPEGLPKLAWPNGIGSDQAMLNWYLRQQAPIPHWTDADGFATFYGKGYERFEHLGVSVRRPTLPAGSRIVVLGSDDKYLLENGHFDWGRHHWGPATQEAAVSR